MKKFALYASILGLVGVVFGAMGAHGIRGKIDEERFRSYRVGIEYLFFHLAPLFYLAGQNFTKNLNFSGIFFSIGILFFTGSTLLMTTEEIHHINFHFLWPITPLGGIFLMIGWIFLIVNLTKK